jgi:hypothetical protein
MTPSSAPSAVSSLAADRWLFASDQQHGVDLCVPVSLLVTLTRTLCARQSFTLSLYLYNFSKSCWKAQSASRIHDYDYLFKVLLLGAGSIVGGQELHHEAQPTTLRTLRRAVVPSTIGLDYMHRFVTVDSHNVVQAEQLRLNGVQNSPRAPNDKSARVKVQLWDTAGALFICSDESPSKGHVDARRRS